MNLFSYVIVEDTGFAPNPFGGFLTLACCKPAIRRVARKGDYIIGTGSAQTVGTTRLIYAAEIFDVVSMEDYGELSKYQVKRPTDSGPWWGPLGDSIYEKVDGRWIMRKNISHASGEKTRDLSGKHVLICKRFWYFGDEPEVIPTRFHELIKKGRFHKKFPQSPLVKQFLQWLQKKPTGIRSTSHLREGLSQSCSSGTSCN